MNVQHIDPPERVRHLVEKETLSIIGNPALLDSAQFGLFCSVKCPASIILKTHDLAEQLKDKGIGVISGFHSPIEKEVLVTLLYGDAPIIVCPARSVENMRVPANWRPHIEHGRMLIVSPFSESQNRPTQETAALRNHFVAAIAQRVFIAYAEPGGKTESFSRELIGSGKPVGTFDSEYTQNLRTMGAE